MSSDSSEIRHKHEDAKAMLVHAIEELMGAQARVAQANNTMHAVYGYKGRDGTEGIYINAARNMLSATTGQLDQVGVFIKEALGRL